MRQLCLSSQPPILISSIPLLYCLQAPFCLGIRLPAPSFAQSTRQACQLDLLHVLQGFVLGVLQEISLALGMHRHAGESQGLHTSLRTKSSNTAPVSLQVSGPISSHFCPLEMGLKPLLQFGASTVRKTAASTGQGGTSTRLAPLPCHHPWEVIMAWTERGCGRKHFLFHSQQQGPARARAVTAHGTPLPKPLLPGIGSHMAMAVCSQPRVP